MRALHVTAGEELHWFRPRRLRLAFELRAGEAVVATLAWSRGSNAVGEWAAGQFRFNRKGWFRPRTLVRGAGTEDTGEPIATFVHRGGMLTFPDGRAYTWRKPKRWTTERVWVDSAGAVLVRYRPATWRAPGAVRIQPETAALPELPLLVLLGQYLLVQAAQEAAAASSAAIVPTIGG